MSHYIAPASQYAEDQQSAKSILGSHVLHRGAQSGALIGGITSALRAALASRKATAAAGLPLLSPVLRSTGTGTLWGTGLSALALTGRMWGRSEIEWQDRSWRLLYNKGQVECDDWSVAGSCLGVAAASIREASVTQAAPGRLLRIVGGFGMGNLAGVLGYMIYRHGLHSGRWD